MDQTHPTAPVLTKPPWPQRLLWSSLAGLAATIVCILADWLAHRDAFGYLDPQATTRGQLHFLDQRIEEFHQQMHRWPQTLEELAASDAGRHMQGPWLDEWNHDLVYEVRGERPLVMSLGRDGKPGGTGFDHDLTGSGPLPAAAAASLGDFLFAQPSRGMILTCVLAGGCVFLLGLYAMSRRSARVVVEMTVCAVFAIAAAVVMSAAHIPIQSSH